MAHPFNNITRILLKNICHFKSTNLYDAMILFNITRILLKTIYQYVPYCQNFWSFLIISRPYYYKPSAILNLPICTMVLYFLISPAFSIYQYVRWHHIIKKPPCDRTNSYIQTAQSFLIIPNSTILFHNIYKTLRPHQHDLKNITLRISNLWLVTPPLHTYRSPT